MYVISQLILNYVNTSYLVSTTIHYALPIYTRSAYSRSAITAANDKPDTESTPKNTSNRTAFTNVVLLANGPDPKAVSMVAIAATIRIDNAVTPTPKRMAAHIMKGSTENAMTCSLTGIKGRSLKMTKQVAARSNRRTESSAMRSRSRSI